MIFGSDYPHAEGLADPKSFVDDLPGFSDDEIRLVMRENGLALRVRAVVTGERRLRDPAHPPHHDRARVGGARRPRASTVPPSLDDEGFIHCSLPTQVTHVADWFYRDVPDLRAARASTRTS